MQEEISRTRRMLWIAAGILIIVIAGLLKIVDPFKNDSLKIDTLRIIGKDEKNSQNISSQFSTYVTQEGIGKDIEKNLSKITADTVATKTYQNPFDDTDLNVEYDMQREFPWYIFESEEQLGTYNSLLLKL